MRLTANGRVTVPKKIRDAIGVGPGSNVGFEERDGEIWLINLDSQSGGGNVPLPLGMRKNEFQSGDQ